MQVSAIREKAWVSFWAGEGFIDWQTKVAGRGHVALRAQGPVEETVLQKGERFAATSKCVIARTTDVAYNIRRPTRSLLKTHVSGEGYCRTYDGPGRLLISSVPYWRFRLFGQQPDEMRNTAAP